MAEHEQQARAQRLKAVLSMAVAEPASVARRTALALCLDEFEVPDVVEVWIATVRAAIRQGQFFPALTLIRQHLPYGLQIVLLHELAKRFGSRPREWAPLTQQGVGQGTMPDLPAHGSGVEELVKLAFRTGKDLSSVPIVPYQKMRRVPLFGTLRGNAFVELALLLEEETLTPGQELVVQGESERTVFLMVHGSAEVTRVLADGNELELAMVKGPTLFGEMSLLTKMPRRATVTSKGPGLAWRVDADTLSRLSDEQPKLFEQLVTVLEKRLLNNLLQTSPLFRTREDRERVLPHFGSKTIEPGGWIFSEGEESPGLFVVLHGEVEIFDSKESSRVVVLSEGDVFGEMSLLWKKKTEYAARTAQGCVLLHLPPEVYYENVAIDTSLPDRLEEIADIRRGEQVVVTASSQEGDDSDSDDGWLIVETPVFLPKLDDEAAPDPDEEALDPDEEETIEGVLDPDEEDTFEGVLDPDAQ